MDFLKLFLRSLALLPAVVQGIEALYGSKTGEQKREAAIQIVGAAVGVVDACGNREIVDAAKFTAALGVIVDGVVACLNASVWAAK